MDENTFFAELLKALPTIIGGLLAIAGGVAAQLISSTLLAKRETKKLRKEKAEQLVNLLYEHVEWLDRERQRLIFGSDHPETPNPLNKAYAIQRLYFPELANALGGITNTLPPLIELMHNEAKERIRDKAKWIEKFDWEKIMPLHRNYLSAFQSAVNEIAKAEGEAKKKSNS